MKKNHFSVIYTADPMYTCLIGIISKLIPAPHIIVDYVDDNEEMASNYIPHFLRTLCRPIIKILIKYTFKVAKKVIVTANELIEDVRQYNKNTIVIPNGVDLNRFRYTPKEKTVRDYIVGYIGGIWNWSGVLTFIKTYDLVKKVFPTVEYHIYGTGNLRTLVEKLASGKAGVKYFGEISYEKVPQIVKNWTIAMIPFKKEKLTDKACPMKLFEYWALGVPTISTNLKEILNIGKDAVFIVEDNHEDMAKGIIELLKSKEKRIRLRNEGLTRAKKYDWSDIAKKIYNVISETLEQ